MKQKKMNQKTIFTVLCLAPAFTLYFIFMLIPTIDVFRMSLYRWSGLNPNKEFILFDNFISLSKDLNFLRSLQNTLFLIVLVTVITIIFALLFSYILSKTDIKGKVIFRVIFYIPNILSIVVIAAIFQSIYQPELGILDSILILFNKENLISSWLADSKIVMFSIAVALIWQAIGYYMVMYMASMSSIPESLYEAADLEGAGHFTKFFDITLPLIWDVIRTTLAFFIISTINLSFLVVNVMTQGGSDGSSQTILGYLYKQAYNNSSYGYGMAIGVVVFTLSFGLSFIINTITKRESIQF